MSKFRWNEPEEIPREFWDADNQTPYMLQKFSSLKYRLSNPEGRTDDVTGDIAKGIAMIMDIIEKLENK